MLTKQDLFLIKELIDVSLSPLRKDIAEMKAEISGIKEEINGIKDDISDIKDELRLFRDDYDNFKVEILNEVRILRDEVSIVVAYRDDIEDHEVRISKLENNK